MNFSLLETIGGIIQQAFFDLRKFREEVLPLSEGGVGGLSLLADHIMPYFVSLDPYRQMRVFY